jgi:hypothetical protein
MTLIVHPNYFGSKAELKANLDGDQMLIENPSVFDGWSRAPSDLPVGFKDVVTNHPKRTKFAQIEKTANGWKVK